MEILIFVKIEKHKLPYGEKVCYIRLGKNIIKVFEFMLFKENNGKNLKQNKTKKILYKESFFHFFKKFI